MASVGLSEQQHLFEQHRGRLFGIAYRMLGTAADAEDVLQDAWLRWQSADRADVADPGAYLATVVTRLSLTALGSARARREVYVGPWLPEPVDTTADPTLGAENTEALSLAVLLLLERLTPAERAAYVLHEAFDYPFQRIAEVLEVSEANARQLASRARKHITEERRTVATGTQRDHLLAAFLAAAQSGDLEALEATLSEDAVSLSDGGGLVSAARKPVHGRQRVAQLILGVLEKFGQGIETVAVVANGAVAMLGVREGHPVALWTLDIAPDGVRRLMIVMNPHKLERFAASALSHS
ncbi:MAG TPA: RNA polymerase sigma-70 factor [Rhodoglobus sp.]|nr:RNA polymerase sigma-70 factor [Rhodoglobus sp.]